MSITPFAELLGAVCCRSLGMLCADDDSEPRISTGCLSAFSLTELSLFVVITGLRGEMGLQMAGDQLVQLSLTIGLVIPAP